MVRLDLVKSSISGLAKSQPLVAVFIGGTSGIGEYTLRALVNTHANEGKGLRIYLVGRNASAADAIISDCRRVCNRGEFHFIQARDLSLLKDVDVVCDRILEMEQGQVKSGGVPRIDLLVMSQACTVFQKRQDTAEGLDFLMSLMYYSRMRAAVRLLPLLTASTLPAAVISVYAAGTEDKVFPDDLLLRKDGRYSYFQARSHVVYMTTLFMEELAKRNSGHLRMAHVFPGLVMTPAFQDPSIPTWFRVLWRCFGGLMARLAAVAPAECGARILSLATPRYPARSIGKPTESETVAAEKPGIAIGTDGVLGGGAYSVNWNGETIPPPKAYKKVDRIALADIVWNHTTKAFDTIEAGEIFTD